MEEEAKEKLEVKSSSGQNEQVFTIISGKDPSWQSIIYDLINSEQLDPWNVDIAVLCKSYFERIKELEQNNFFVSSKLLLAAALLLRIKSEILISKYIREIDNILFNKEEEIVKVIQRIEIDEDEIPILSPKTPLPRFKKVTLQELISALDVAIKTESRRINKEIEKKQAERLSYVDIPKFRRINIKDRIRQFYARILTSFKNKKAEVKLPYSDFTGNSKEEKISCFLPMLYLSNNRLIWLEQNSHFSEIYLYLYDVFKKNFPEFDSSMLEAKESSDEDFKSDKVENFDEVPEEEKEETLSEAEKEKRVEKVNSDFENPIGNMIDDKIQV